MRFNYERLPEPEIQAVLSNWYSGNRLEVRKTLIAFDVIDSCVSCWDADDFLNWLVYLRKEEIWVAKIT